MSASHAPPPQLEHRPSDLSSEQDSGADTSTSKSDYDRDLPNSNSQHHQYQPDGPNSTPPTEGLNHRKDPLFQMLPIDVIDLIFCDAGDFNLNTWRRGLHPFELAKVCQAWRKFLLSSPILWDTVVLKLPFSKGPVEIGLLREWLARTNARPLKIFITHRPSSSHIPPFINSVFSTLLQVSAQWQILWLEIPPAWFPLCNLQRLPPLPLLQSLTLKKVRAMAGPGNVEFIVNVPSAPKLTHLGVAGIQADGLSLPWGRIESLIVERTGCVITHGILSKCSRLKEATVTNPTSETSPVPGLKANPLTSFAVDEVADDTSLETTFQSLIFPYMSSLSITLQADTYAPQTIYRFVERSQCNLLRLDFGCPIFREDTLIELLTEIRTLRELHLTHLPQSPQLDYDDQAPNHGLTSMFFEIMHPDAYPFYLPNLEVFTYKGPLIIYALDDLESLILRTGARSEFDEWDHPLSFSMDSETVNPGALLKTVKIRAANQMDAEGEVVPTIAEYTEASYVWDIIQLVEAGTFELVNEDGSMWF